MISLLTKIVLVIVIILLIFDIYFYMFVIGPKKDLLNNMETGQEGIVKLKDLLEEDRAFIKDLEKYEKEYEEAEANLQELKNSGL